jgi:hypothetical protein
MTVQEAIQRAEAILPGTPGPPGKEDPRWQAIIAISEFVETNPDEVWNFVARWGSHEDEDLRSAVTTCLLEHLLEHHFGLIFPRVERAVKQSSLFAEMFRSGAKFGQSESPDNAKRFDWLQTKSLFG